MDKPTVTFAPPSSTDIVSQELTIRVPDCRGACETLRRRGATFLTPPVEHESPARGRQSADQIAVRPIGARLVKIGTEIESPQTGERLIFRSTADSSNGQLFRAELIVKPGPYVVGAHIHPSQDESFVVLEGAYGYEIGDRKGVAQPGDPLVCPVSVPHSQWNAGAGILRIYYVHRPALTSRLSPN